MLMDQNCAAAHSRVDVRGHIDLLLPTVRQTRRQHYTDRWNQPHEPIVSETVTRNRCSA